MEVSIKDQNTIMTSFHNIVFSKYFIEHNIGYQPGRFHWPRLSVSNFALGGGGSTPFQTYTI